MSETIRFVDLFAGIGGIRKGFELACRDKGFRTECVFTSEIKPYAIKVLKQNHPNETINGDITQVEAASIPDFDFCLLDSLAKHFLLLESALDFRIHEEHYFSMLSVF